MKKLFIVLLMAAPLRAADVELIAVDARGASLSRDGQLIAYESKSDILVYDHRSHVAQRIAGRDARRPNGGPNISTNGNLLAYHAYTTSVESTMEARLSDIRVLNRGRNTQELITPAYGTTLQDGEALYPKFAQNGRYVVFTSNATNLLPAKRDPVRAAFVHDRYKGMLEVVSRNSSGDLADRPVGNPSISQDGRYVFFKSAATNLLGKLPVSHLGSHLYRFDRWKTQIIRIDDEDRSFDETRWVSGDYAINDDGSLVVFEGRDRDVADFDQQLSATSLFIFDESTGVIHPLLPDEYAGKAHSPAMNADGRFVVFALRPGLAVMDRKSGEIRTVHESECENPVVSGDGRIIVFEAKRFVLNEGKPVLQAPSKPGATNIYLTTNPFN